MPLLDLRAPPQVKRGLACLFLNSHELFQTFGSCFLISQFPDIWISEAESERVKEGEREINALFSSPPSADSASWPERRRLDRKKARAEVTLSYFDPQ